MSAEPVVPAEILAAIRAPLAALGPEPIDPPIIQPLAPLLDMAGEAMRARLLVVQGEGDEDACLRPDFTIPVTRAHIAAGEGERRYIYEGKAFLATPPSSGLPREFFQVGLEAFGGQQDAAFDGELAAACWRAVVAGGRKDLSLMLGDVGLFGAFIGALGLAEPLALRLRRAFAHPRALQVELDRAQDAPRGERQGDRVSALIADLPETEATAVLEDLWALAGIAPVGGRSAAEIVHRLAERAARDRAPRLSPSQAGLVRDFLAISDRPKAALDKTARLAKRGGLDLDAALEGWTRRLAALTAGGVNEGATTLSTAFGRAFGYYDGFLFEVRSAALGEDSPAGGGGRYDSLPARLGGSADGGGAIGCMVRPARAWSGGELTS